jgi:hypothetical protein
MHVRVLAWVTVFGVGALPGPAQAQRTGDQARLIFTVSGGFVGGKDLWLVNAQPAQVTTPADTLALSRSIRPTLTIGFEGTYFPSEHIGLAVDGFLVGLGFEDSCRVTFPSGSSDVANACQSIQGAKKVATSVVLSAGPVFRLNSRALISPYARGSAGVVFSTQSPLGTVGHFETQAGLADLIIYSDDHESRVEPAFALGAGFTAAIAAGYQLRWEVRDNIVGVQRVTGPLPQAGGIPPHKLDYKHLFSMMIGFDVVLERRRGKRY